MGARHYRRAARGKMPLAALLELDPALPAQLAAFGPRVEWPEHGRVWRRRNGTIRTVQFSGGYPLGSLVITVRYGG